MSNKRITTATPEQWTEIERIRQWWIDEQTVTQPDDEIRRTVEDMWELMGHGRPEVVICDSPITSQMVLSSLRSSLGSSLDSSLRSSLGSSLDSSLGSSLRSSLDSSLRSSLGSSLGLSLRSSLGSSLDSSLRSSLDSSLGSSLRSSLDSSLHSSLGHISVWWRAWAGWYEGGKVLGVQYDDSKYDLFRRWSLCCPYVEPYESLVVVSRNPAEVHWQGGVLHNESGPSVKYADGWGIYSIEGQLVDEQIVMRPETQTVEQIDNEESNDIRAIRLERYGAGRYLTETGARVLDDRAVPVEGTHEALLEDKNGQRWLWPTCPSGRICPPLRVPREINSCASASQWVAGSKPFRVVART